MIISRSQLPKLYKLLRVQQISWSQDGDWVPIFLLLLLYFMNLGVNLSLKCSLTLVASSRNL
jgi:hypothetical protein